MTTEARDNLKFLATLERHLGILESAPLPAVLDAIAPLLAALRLVLPHAMFHRLLRVVNTSNPVPTNEHELGNKECPGII